MPQDTISKSPNRSISRLMFIDMFRGFITLVMLEGHVTNSTIQKTVKLTKEFHYLDLFNGMIAPSFIFIAGFSVGLVLDRKWGSLIHLEKPLWMQFRRLLFVIAVGYWLHLPTWSFQTLLKLDRNSILWFLRCDVLHLIGFSLIMILLLAIVIRNRKLHSAVLFFLSIVVVFATPFVYDLELRNYVPFPLSDYLNSRYGALFPLFPWMAYAFLGTAVCTLYLQCSNKGTDRRLFLSLTVLGSILLPAAFALFYVPFQFHNYIDPAQSSPRHFMMKTGFIFIVLSGLWYWEQRRKPTKSFLTLVGQESLYVYGFHLIIVYGSSFTSWCISRNIGPVLTFLPSFTISFILIASMIMAASVWHFLKNKHPRFAKALFYTLCFLYFARFFTT